MRIQTTKVHTAGVILHQEFSDPQGNVFANGYYPMYQELKASTFNRSDITVNNKDGDGYRAPSNYYAGSTSYLVVNSDCSKVDNNANGYRYSREWTGFTLAKLPEYVSSQASIANARNRIRSQVLNNIKDEILDVTMVLGELQGTVDTATSLMSRIGRSLQAFKKGKPKSFYYLLNGRTRDGRKPTDRFLRQVASEYLQWKYGIMPTVYDLEGVIKGMAINSSTGLFSNPPLLVARSTYTNTSKGSKTLRTSWGTTLNVPYEERFTVKARCDFVVTGEGLRGLNRYGIGVTSLATLAYDRTPFSFVLDMLIPISSIIKAWGALQGCTVKGYSETVYIETDWLPSKKVDPSVYYPDYETEPQTTRFTSRIGSSTVPMPLPYIKNPVSTGNISTILALFTALRK